MDKSRKFVKIPERQQRVFLRNQSDRMWFEIDYRHPAWREVWSIIGIGACGFDEHRYVPETRVYKKIYLKKIYRTPGNLSIETLRNCGYDPEQFAYDIRLDDPCTSLITPDHPKAKLVVRVLRKALCQ